MDVRDLSGKIVLVTGAASGIGKETALSFGRRGATLAICDVNDEGLGTTAEELRKLGRTVISERVDVSRWDDVSSFAELVHASVPAVDVLVNNAGVGLGGGFLDTKLDDWKWIVDINLWGVIHGCHAFVPKMVERGAGGHVVIVSSAAGYVATEALAAYATTKFAVLGLAEALRDELHKHQIPVTAICPGIIDTPITKTSRLVGRAAQPGYRELVAEQYRRRGYGPARVAEKIVKAVARDAAVAPVTPEAWGMYLLKRVAPGVVAWLNRRVSERVERQYEASRGHGGSPPPG